MDRINDLDNSQAFDRIKRAPPEIFHLAADVTIFNRTVVREEHRNQTGIRCALHVVLTAQRMQSRTLAPNMAGDQGQRNQTAGIVSTMRVLRDAHAPENDRPFRRRIKARNRFQRVGINTTDLGHFFRRKVFDLFLQRFKTIGIRLNVLFVIQFFIDDCMDKGIQHRHVGAGLEFQ